MSKEICIRCGHPTPYDVHTPISSRLYYVEGSGQFCEQCFSQLNSSSSDSSLILEFIAGEKHNDKKAKKVIRRKKSGS